MAGNIFVALAAFVMLAALPVAVLVGRKTRLGVWLFECSHSLTLWERRRAGIVLRRIFSGKPVTGGRLAAWLGLEASVGLICSLIAGYLLLGGLNALTFPAWWPLTGMEATRPLPGVRITTWPQALLVPLLGVAYAIILLAGARPAGRLLSTLSVGRLGLDPDAAEAGDTSQVRVHGAELRRIERALHDGTQARIVNANVQLGIAQLSLTDRVEERDRIQAARAELMAALAELRGVVDAVLPPILSERGLAGAVRALGSRCALPCEVHVEPLGVVSPAIESAGYFVVAECLTNAVRHADATGTWVQLTRDPDRLYVQVIDDGLGGAHEGVEGGGLYGLRRRTEAFAGSMSISSPSGGPTSVLVELPCVS
ncbi:sensor histidine kinase [Nocardioides jensenii]|uniref:sensor histidine kinase n=1 Tax=Nocardioides jensenii TaxID=1843 RepID=UPI0014702049|nr:ATP-binding protein [Nocardioides jensenii]